MSSRALAALLVLSAGCFPASRASSTARRSWLVIAPHPDDEVLVAGGVLAHAVEEGDDVAVAVMTNGDYDCLVDGLVREAETIDGLGALGVPEARVRFLGYPDGALASLGRKPLARRRRAGGRCEIGDTTYGARGAGHTDYHRARWGAPARYTRANVVADLAALLEEIAPTDVAVTHPGDNHPDHEATYGLFRDALDRVGEAPRVHRALVHNGDCWPTGATADEPCPPNPRTARSPTPPLSGRLAGYQPAERLPVPSRWLDDERRDAKLRAIGAHRSQTRGSHDSYLFAFARSDEPFFPESFERHGGSWLRRGTVPIDAMRSRSLVLEAGRPVACEAMPPIAIAARFPRAEVEIAVLEDESGAYVLDIDAPRREARIFRRRGGPAGALDVLRAFPLPHDLWSGRSDEPFELRIDPRPEDGPVAELSLRVGGSLVGVAIDPHRRAGGTSIRSSRSLSLRVSVSPSARPVR